MEFYQYFCLILLDYLILFDEGREDGMIEFTDKKEVYRVNLLDAVRFVHKAWECVTEKLSEIAFVMQGLFRRRYRQKSNAV